jgi:hypothetical protein
MGLRLAGVPHRASGVAAALDHLASATQGAAAEEPLRARP